MSTSELDAFHAEIPLIDEFADVANASGYRPIPDGWLVGTSDVVNSTGAIAAGRYKAVNMVGASVIAAVRNAVSSNHIPFVFGGDGAAFIIPASAEEKAAQALSAVSTWSQEEIDLQLRTALVPIEEVREAGFDVQVAQFAASPDVRYAMFSGGGVAWAEEKMKSGEFTIAPAPAGARPDLTSLSCRWQPIEALRGMIASLLVLRRDNADVATYRKLIRDIVTYIHEREVEEGRPVTEQTAKFALSGQAMSLEARALGGRRSYLAKRIGLWFYYLFVWYLFARQRKIGDFDPVRYKRETVRNTDFRKFDDGLKLTIDCSQTTYEGLQALLDGARADGVADYGLHAQANALMTCIVPSESDSDHMHFVDGAGGGYAKAAEMLKAQKAEAP
ncbi:MAG: DUF3095 domain-containing protein [Pseudomonadota bacterium]